MTVTENVKKLLIVLAGLLAWQTTQAQLEIEIISGNASALPIAIVPFDWQESSQPPATRVDEIISGDLYRSGLFDPMEVADMAERPTEGEAIRFGNWRLLKVDYIVVGKVRTPADGQGHELIYQLFDVHSQEMLLSRITTVGPGDLRFGAHRVADSIYEALTGVPGAFSTRIAYITATGLGNDQRYELVVADADGFAPQSIVGSPEPLLSPAWSPDGRHLAYVSFEQGNSAIYMQNVSTGSRELISSGRGINGAPSFSPDGKKMALTLSKSGNPEIYVRDMATGRLQQLTQHWSIDTEPVWAPDGRYIYFTSDRGGRPQIYRVSPSGGAPDRVTLEGDYNARASISPNGRRIAVAQGRGNEYRIAVWDLETERFTILTPGTLDESPSFAPNGSMILYATREGSRGVLSAVSADGNVRQRLILSEGDVREPAWSPVIR
ncbi:MAG: Tol-Pal system beta propeller repeat protein TolB [Xanthomonadales bacterium]|nr:Tol-Pal system beta propeller repeat protein TolB [Gammaproteobacteria bacterium]MBT8053686.1 Tol-Pal system beta propeller repeat protein TolB [Gammaproteobacteria bacterium]NND57059.1 Tol-Pal system beta propeller repeat protein TolB [Xanthomonadales bacterium]NNK51859.1 Tol-Pal system beta propeller repeat protein TolB [Xanthomonadales bacterium]